MRNRLTQRRQETMYFIGIHKKAKRIKFTDDRDCLSPDIEEFGYIQRIPSHQKIEELEAQGVTVCIDTALFFYESKL